MRLATVPAFYRIGGAELDADRPHVRAGGLEHVGDGPGCRLYVFGRQRIQIEHVTLEVRVRIGVRVPLRPVVGVRPEQLPVVAVALAEDQVQALVVPLAAVQRRDDEVRSGILRVAEVVEASHSDCGSLIGPG